MKPLHLGAIVIALLGSTLAIGPQSESIDVDDPRPLAKALDTFESMFGWIVTYEDPAYEHPSDLEDVTLKVRKPTQPSQPRVLVPRGGQFSARFATPPPDSSTTQVATIVADFLKVHASRGFPGHFSVTSSEDVLHVLPTAVLGPDGNLKTQNSILDAKLSLPNAPDRSAYAALKSVLSSVAAQRNVEVNLGLSPIALLNRTQMPDSVVEGTARDALTKILKATGSRLSWRLFYDPGLKVYVFNVHSVGSERQ